MSARISPAPLSYSQAADALGSKSEMKIGHNTKLYRVAPDTIRASYHDNDIVEYTPEAVYATWAGWASSTTRDRLNKLTTAQFNIKQFGAYMNGKPVDPYTWNEVK